jgi:hypothetical protein
MAFCIRSAVARQVYHEKIWSAKVGNYEISLKGVTINYPVSFEEENNRTIQVKYGEKPHAVESSSVRSLNPRVTVDLVINCLGPQDKEKIFGLADLQFTDTQGKSFSGTYEKSLADASPIGNMQELHEQLMQAIDPQYRPGEETRNKKYLKADFETSAGLVADTIAVLSGNLVLFKTIVNEEVIIPDLAKGGNFQRQLKRIPLTLTGQINRENPQEGLIPYKVSVQTRAKSVGAGLDAEQRTSEIKVVVTDASGKKYNPSSYSLSGSTEKGEYSYKFLIPATAGDTKLSVGFSTKSDPSLKLFFKIEDIPVAREETASSQKGTHPATS